MQIEIVLQYLFFIFHNDFDICLGNMNYIRAYGVVFKDDQHQQQQ